MKICSTEKDQKKKLLNTSKWMDLKFEWNLSTSTLNHVDGNHSAKRPYLLTRSSQALTSNNRIVIKPFL